MWNVIRRALVPGVLLLGGIAMVVYGAASRRLPVWEEALVEEKMTEEQEIEVPIGPPEPLPPELGGLPPGAMPGGVPPLAGPPMTVKQKILVDVVKKIETERKVDEAEYVVLRELTVGGIALVDPDKLMRTYRRAEAGWDAAEVAPPPSQCPT
jgi:hypothetical protein